MCNRTQLISAKIRPGNCSLRTRLESEVNVLSTKFKNIDNIYHDILHIYVCIWKQLLQIVRKGYSDHMKIRTVFVVALVVLSGTVVWAGGPALATDQSETSHPVSADETATNSTQEYRGVEVRPDELRNVTLDRSSIPETVEQSESQGFQVASTHPQVGTTKLFPALNYKTGQYYLKNFTLRAYSDHGAIWVATNLSWPSDDPRETPMISDAQVEYLMQEFENNIYPTDTRIFGAPDRKYGTNASLSGPPGEKGAVPDSYYQSPDNESRTVILVDNIRDKNYYNSSYPVFTAGYFSSRIGQFTDRNVLTMDAANWDNRLGPLDAPWRPENASEDAYSIEATLAHELQHLIHSDRDPDEKTWINEGMSEYAAYAAGYGVPSSIQAFEQNPENSLVEWGDQGEINIIADYGKAGLFQIYLKQQYGTDFIENLVRDPANGIAGVENTLNEAGERGDFYTLYQDFQTAFTIDSLENLSRPVPDRYRFEGIDLDVNTSETQERAVAWGTTYNSIDTSGKGPIVEFTADGIDFQSTPWKAVPAPGGSDDTVLWGNRGNLKDNNAIMQVDLRNTESSTLTFETYYDIERGWDYGFVQISTDGGETWTTLSNENTSDYLAAPQSAYPPIAENLPGFTGDTSGEWVTESFDLSKYSGQKVLISFRYMTDYAVNGNSSEIPGTGWYLRDIRVPEAGLSYDGSTTRPFQSLNEVRKKYVNYQFTFIGVTENGLYQVKQLDRETFENGDAEELREFLRAPIYDRIIFTSTWAARPGETGTVPYEYDPVFLDEFIDDHVPGQQDRSGAANERKKPEIAKR
jgi:immune inhibitor A